MYNGLSLSPLRHPEYGIRIPGRCQHGRLRHTKSSHSLPALYTYIYRYTNVYLYISTCCPVGRIDGPDSRLLLIYIYTSSTIHLWSISGHKKGQNKIDEHFPLFMGWKCTLAVDAWPQKRPKQIDEHSVLFSRLYNLSHAVVHGTA